MARSNTNSLAGQAARGARKVIGQPEESSAGQESAPAKKTTAKKAAARKSPAKRTPAKKAAATQVSAGGAGRPKPSTRQATALVVKEGEDAWTRRELTEVLAELQAQRERSRTIVGEHEHELNGLMRDAGDGAGQDQADVGSTTFERDHELHVLSSERDKVAQIDRALHRIDDGTYGACENCNQPIGKMRLMAFPRATLCLICKQREERR